MAQYPKYKTKFLLITNANSLKAAIFHTMAFKMSLEVNNDKVTTTKRSFRKVLYHVCKVKKKNINFEQYARIHLDGPKVAVCETVSYTVFVVNSSFTTKDKYFRAAIDEACKAFNKMMQDFGYTQKLEIYDAYKHQTNPPQQHPLSLLQLVFNTSTLSIASAGLHCFNWSFRHWVFATQN